MKRSTKGTPFSTTSLQSSEDTKLATLTPISSKIARSNARIDSRNKRHKKSKFSLFLKNSSNGNSISKLLKSRVRGNRHFSYGGNGNLPESTPKTLVESRSQIRKRRINKIYKERSHHGTPQCETPDIDHNIPPIQKLRRCIRKITLANRFLETTYGSVQIKVELDHYKK